MIYTELVAVIMGISLIFYMILGGADFGAGIIELLMGDEEQGIVTRAMAPVWEANHIWLIIAVVILFNGFPEAYAVFSTALHIPILLVLLGIIGRGSAFTFRHYDAYQGEAQRWYSVIFRYSSAFTVLFLGIVVGALFGGTIPPGRGESFLDYFIYPWANLFCLSIGVFLAILSTYIAGIFLIGEVKTDEAYRSLQIFTKRLFLAALVSGAFILIVSFFQGRDFHRSFLGHPGSILCVGLATISIPFIFVLITKRQTWWLRILAGAQITFIMMGWFFVQWPDLISFSDGNALSIYEATAPEATMRILFWALLAGVFIIFPALYYLYKIFKTGPDNKKLGT
jgi:cytochrome bd ubiquinol oxidase subunit II